MRTLIVSLIGALALGSFGDAGVVPHVFVCRPPRQLQQLPVLLTVAAVHLGVLLFLLPGVSQPMERLRRY